MSSEFATLRSLALFCKLIILIDYAKKSICNKTIPHSKFILCVLNCIIDVIISHSQTLTFNLTEHIILGIRFDFWTKTSSSVVVVVCETATSK